MIDKKDYGRVRVELQACLGERFDGVTVQIADDLHYRGTNIVVAAPAFRGLLPEQRYHHVVRAIPPDLYERHLRSGVVWFELAPGETARDLMQMPRSDDIADEEDTIVERLTASRFFEKLQAELGGSRQNASIDDFVLSRQLLTEAGLDQRSITRACLLFIRHGAFCDAQVLMDVLPKLASDHAA